MIRSSFPRSTLPALVLTCALLAAACAPASPSASGSTPVPAAQSQASVPERAVRRTVPITNTIRRALEAGTRDSSGRPGRNYWQLRTDYDIAVRLDTATSRLHGRETITLHNTSPDSLRQIVLRLDPNIFLPNTPKAAPWVIGESTDGMVLERMTVNGAAVNLAPPTGPGSSNAPLSAPTLTGGRTTVARLNLVQPVLPGARATLEIDWNHKLPGGQGIGHRMTMRWGDTLYQPTQWYPRVARYDDLRGWDTELYLGPAEFHNNFGTFDVRIDVPAGWIVSGTGVLQNAEQLLAPEARQRLQRALTSDSVTTIIGQNERSLLRPGAARRSIWHFRADTVNDFAWASSRSYVWRTTRATIPGKGAVPIHMVHLPGRAHLYERADERSRHALEFYSRLWFPYRFPQLTLQDGPSAGMEYPMVINSNQGAADHEVAHQWWPMVVGNNETWYGWMDEGFNQYMNILSDADAEGQPAVLDGLGQSYGQVSGDESEPPLMWNSNYASPASNGWGFVTYRKTPLMLSALGGVVSDSAVQRAHREWAQAWEFKHPSPWDWMFFMNRALGRDLGWFWYYWLFTTERTDGSIQSATTTTAGLTTVIVRQDGEMPSPVVLDVTLAPAGATVRPPANATMTSDTTAVVRWPADVWFPGSRTFTATLDFGGRAVTRVKLDPQCRFPDRDPSDNIWPRGAAPGTCAR
jgi:hypothetical protein